VIHPVHTTCPRSGITHVLLPLLLLLLTLLSVGLGLACAGGLWVGGALRHSKGIDKVKVGGHGPQAASDGHRAGWRASRHRRCSPWGAAWCHFGKKENAWPAQSICWLPSELMLNSSPRSDSEKKINLD